MVDAKAGAPGASYLHSRVLAPCTEIDTKSLDLR